VPTEKQDDEGFSRGNTRTVIDRRRWEAANPLSRWHIGAALAGRLTLTTVPEHPKLESRSEICNRGLTYEQAAKAENLRRK
jgi:hypothetical protein